MINSDQIPSLSKIACIGEAMIELSAIDLGQRQARVGVAGDTFNTAVYLRRALKGTATSVDFVTAVGFDKMSDAIIKAFESEGLGTDLLLRHPSRTSGIYSIIVDSTGERSFSYWRSQSAARSLFGDIGPDLNDLAAYSALFCHSIDHSQWLHFTCMNFADCWSGWSSAISCDR
jgi:2-dehydro-3-deoxygluconokinase